jgi:hypothetical protein
MTIKCISLMLSPLLLLDICLPVMMCNKMPGLFNGTVSGAFQSLKVFSAAALGLDIQNQIFTSFLIFSFFRPLTLLCFKETVSSRSVLWLHFFSMKQILLVLIGTTKVCSIMLTICGCLSRRIHHMGSMKIGLQRTCWCYIHQGVKKPFCL